MTFMIPPEHLRGHFHRQAGATFRPRTRNSKRYWTCWAVSFVFATRCLSLMALGSGAAILRSIWEAFEEESRRKCRMDEQLRWSIIHMIYDMTCIQAKQEDQEAGGIGVSLPQDSCSASHIYIRLRQNTVGIDGCWNLTWEGYTML